MILRPLRDEERALYNATVSHPLQSWEWGEFRKKTGLTVERVGFFENGQLRKALQVTFHPIPVFGGKAGYLPKGYEPDDEQLAALKQLGEQNNALFIKLEPNVAHKVGEDGLEEALATILTSNGAQPGKPLFTKYTFQLDLQKTQEELFSQLNSKTRYNVSLAHKKGVVIVENTTEQGMEEYLKILQETTTRQGFYAHSPSYFKTMWQTLGNSGMMRIFEAQYEGQVLVSWIMFLFNGTLYYPYGASRSVNRDVMASNLLMWEMMIFGKNNGCQTFDMWGSLGPNPNERDPWYGFHRFKKGYGGELMEFLGTYDLVLQPQMYKFFRIAENFRWKLLRIKAKLKR